MPRIPIEVTNTMSRYRKYKRRPTLTRGRGVTVAHQVFTLTGEGSNPSDPTAATPQKE